MGCDIHMYAEVKRKDLDYWVAVGRIFKNEWYNEKHLSHIDGDGYCYNEKYTEHPFSQRDYDLYGMLADVRNGTWGEKIKPISEPKGLPQDVSKYVKKQSDEWATDGHSRSFLTLEEIEKYNWKKKVKRNAFVSKQQAKDYKEKGIVPKSYAAWSSMGVQLEWDDEVFSKEFIEKTIPALKKLKKHGDVRIVFWFDN